MHDKLKYNALMEEAIAATAQAAVSGLEGGLPDDVLDEMRLLIRAGLREDPEAQALLRLIVTSRMRPDESAKMDMRGVAQRAGAGSPEVEGDGAQPKARRRTSSGEGR